MIKIATWNVNSLRVRLPQVQDWLVAQQPDILALQETKTPDSDFPAADLENLGYHVVYAGQKTYNGVAILCRGYPTDVIDALPAWEDPQRRFLGITVGKLRLLNLYVPNGQTVNSDKYTYKLAWLEKLMEYLRDQVARYSHLTLVGDFNIAPEDCDVHDPQRWAGKVMCSETERAAFRELLQLGFKDTFRLFESSDNGFTWWDYRQGSFPKNHGLRIDHILASHPLAHNCISCQVDREPRACERPSDHAPVMAVFTGAD